MIAVARQLSREVPPEWRASLRSIDPIREAHSYLEFGWDGATERWWLFEMVPVWATPPEILDELRGPNPDTLETYKKFNRYTNELIWEEHQTIITPRQWRMFQQYGRWARPCWVIQGTKGGHLYAYEEEHLNAAKVAGLPLEPPASGSLPYAGWDERVKRQILRLNMLLEVNNDLDEFLRRNTGDGAKSKQNEKRKQYRREMVKWLKDSVEEPAEHFTTAFKTGEADVLPVRDVDWERADERQSINFVETGSLSATPE